MEKSVLLEGVSLHIILRQIDQLLPGVEGDTRASSHDGSLPYNTAALFLGSRSVAVAVDFFTTAVIVFVLIVVCWR